MKRVRLRVRKGVRFYDLADLVNIAVYRKISSVRHGVEYEMPTTNPPKRSTAMRAGERERRVFNGRKASQRALPGSSDPIQAGWTITGG